MTINIIVNNLNHTYVHVINIFRTTVAGKKKQLHVLTYDHGVDFPHDLNCTLVALINVNCLRCFWLSDNQVAIVFLIFL